MSLYVEDISDEEKQHNKLEESKILDANIDEARWISFINGGGLLKGVPRSQRSRSVCLTAVKRNGRSLGEVPNFHIDAEMVEAALHQSPLALKFVPAKLKTLKRCVDALLRDEKVEMFIPDDLSFECNDELYRRKIKRGMVLKNVKKKHRTKELCQYAVECNWKNLEFCPVEYLTEELAQKALNQKQGSVGLRYVPEQIVTLEMCLFAVRKAPTAFKYVPKKYQEDVKSALETEGIEIKALERNRKQL